MIKKIDAAIDYILSFNIYNIGLAFARTSLALSTLLTIIFNNPYKFFNPTIRAMNGELVFNDSIFEKINIFKLLYGNSPWLANIIAIVILFFVISGYFPKISGILHFWISYSFLCSASLIDGGDQINSNLCLLLIPIMLIDNRKNQWIGENKQTKTTKLITNLIFIVISIQVSAIYFQAATSKLQIEEWKNGSAVYYWLVDPIFGLNTFLKLVFSPLVINKYLITFLTWGTLFVEVLLFAALIVNKKHYKLLFQIGIALHLGFLIFIGTTKRIKFPMCITFS